MRIILLSDDRIRFEGGPGGLSIEADSSERAYSPFHMVASGLATCVFSVLESWGEQAGASSRDLALEIGWEFADGPRRVSRYEVILEWPTLPENRRSAVARAAALCPIHATFETPPEISVEMAS